MDKDGRLTKKEERQVKRVERWFVWCFLVLAIIALIAYTNRDNQRPSLDGYNPYFPPDEYLRKTFEEIPTDPYY